MLPNEDDDGPQYRFVVLQPPPRFMNEQEIRKHFGLSERAMRRVRAIPSFPRRNDLVGKWDRKLVDRFFDRLSGLDPTGRIETQPVKERY